MIPGIPIRQEGDGSLEEQNKSLPASRPGAQRVLTDEALPYSLDLSSLLRGQVGVKSSLPPPPPCVAMWMWKTQAAHVRDGKVVAVKADSRDGGLGCGIAGRGEKVLLFLAGSDLCKNGPLVGPIAWTMIRQSGLRLLIVKTRRLARNGQRNQFPASLQDALAGYTYLVDRLGFLPENITLLGEGTGASLCISLTLYLSAALHSGKGSSRIGRPAKLLLFSPWCDMTVSDEILQEHSKVDVVDVDSRLAERSRFIKSFDKTIPQDRMLNFVEDLCNRYTTQQSKDHIQIDLALLGDEFPDTIHALGPAHPLVSPGMPQLCNRYTGMSMKLLQTSMDTSPLRILICAGSAESHVTEARSLANNLSSLDNVQVDYIEGEDKVTAFSFFTSNSASLKVDEIAQAFLGQ
jgi:acetyl esterase/lipase